MAPGRMVISKERLSRARGLLLSELFAGMRGRVITTRENLWRGGPFKPLTEGIIKTGGRNNSGKITAWHRGGGAKRLYRCIDFVRSGKQGPGVVERLEYDPNRSAHIALVRHPEGDASFFTSFAF